MNDNLHQELNEVMKMRLTKLAQIKELGENPFAYEFDRTHTAEIVLANFEELEEIHHQVREELVSY